MNDLILRPSDLPDSQNPALVYLRSLAKGSRRTQETALREIAHHMTNGRLDHIALPWHILSYQHVQALRADMLDIPDYKAATINRYLSAVRGVLKEAWQLGLMDSDTYLRAITVKNVKSVALPPGRMIASEEMKALIQSCLLDNKDTGKRDAAALALMYVTGMRRSEICKLQIGDFDVQTGEVRIIASKGNKSRTSYIDGKAKQHVIEWMKVRGLSPGAMFVTVDQHGNLNTTHLNPQTLYDMIQRRAKQAGIDSLSVHDLRRTAISEMLARGVDISTVAKIVGHERLDTTRRYDRRDEESKRAVSRLYDTPI